MNQNSDSPETDQPVAAPAIIEDDQQLYDWGIENRMEQYYQDNNGNPNHVPPQPQPHYDHAEPPGYVPNNPNLCSDPNSAEFEYGSQPPDSGNHLQPPPAHQNSSYPQQYGQQRNVKSEPGMPHQAMHGPPHHGPSQVPFHPSQIPMPIRSGRRPLMNPVDMDVNEILKV